MGESEPSDEAVVERVRAGGTEEFRLLVERHAGRLYRLCHRITGGAEDADDAVQEALLSAYRHLERWDGRAAFGTWLHRIAANAAVDLVRKRRRRRETPGDDLPAGGLPVERGPGPDRRLASREIGERIRRALAALTPHERAAFALRHLAHLPTAEVGEALGITANASKQAVFRAVRKLRLELADEPARTRVRGGKR